MARYLFRNAKILDAERGDYLAESSVLVEGERIVEVGEADVQASDAQSFDLHGMTLMPGLIDAHVHVTAVTADLAAMWAGPIMGWHRPLQRGIWRDRVSSLAAKHSRKREGMAMCAARVDRRMISVTAVLDWEPSVMAWMRCARPPARRYDAEPPISSSC